MVESHATMAHATAQDRPAEPYQIGRIDFSDAAMTENEKTQRGRLSVNLFSRHRNGCLA